jgi:hypothetical protein
MRPPDRHAAGREASPRLASRLAATPALRRNRRTGRSTPIWLICAPHPSRPKTEQDTLNRRSGRMAAWLNGTFCDYPCSWLMRADPPLYG